MSHLGQRIGSKDNLRCCSESSAALNPAVHEWGFCCTQVRQFGSFKTYCIKSCCAQGLHLVGGVALKWYTNQTQAMHKFCTSCALDSHTRKSHTHHS
eukprot:1156629-Pelagomonas_calceolata.AAC.2